MKICADGYMRITQSNRVKTPGKFDSDLEPMAPRDAVNFLLSHTFPGHRRVVRGPNPLECRLLHRAFWADSVSERMTLVDRVWRSLTRPTDPPANGDAELVQVVRCGNDWAYPVHLRGETTLVIPGGGLPIPELNGNGEAPVIEIE